MGLFNKCLACQKTLVDEVLPLCSRCQRQGFRLVIETGKWVAIAAVAYSGIKNAQGNKNPKA